METKIMFGGLKHLKGKLVSSKKVDICMVSALMMAKICRDLGTPTFMISMTDLTPLQVMATNTLNNILAKYHDFSDVFSGEKVGTLTPHHMISRSMSKKVQNPFTDQSIHPPWNLWPCGNSLRSIPRADSSTQVNPHGGHPSYLSKRKMAASAYA